MLSPAEITPWLVGIAGIVSAVLVHYRAVRGNAAEIMSGYSRLKSDLEESLDRKDIKIADLERRLAHEREARHRLEVYVQRLVGYLIEQAAEAEEPVPDWVRDGLMSDALRGEG